MYLLVVFAVGCASVSHTQEQKTTVHDFNDEVISQFKKFVLQYNRSYINDHQEYQYRMAVFADSLERQKILNQKEQELNGRAVYGINKFSDWTREEFIGSLSKFHPNKSFQATKANSCCNLHMNASKLLKASWDWRKKGKVTSVKNQGNCGSCWAFAAAAVVETQSAISKRMTKAIDLSVQELVSCSESAGCEGGTISGTLLWLQDTQYCNQSKCEKVYLLPASKYPYEETQSKCKYLNIEPKTGAQISCSCSKNFKGRETELANYVSTIGSIAVGVNAVMWHDYIGGIIQHHCTDVVIDHAVNVEGYDTAGEIPFWIVRNSWGSNFGENGYLYIKMYDNICGIAEHVSYVEI